MKFRTRITWGDIIEQSYPLRQQWRRLADTTAFSWGWIRLDDFTSRNAPLNNTVRLAIREEIEKIC